MSRQPFPIGTVTLLFTDLEGSTKRWEALPQQMATALLTHDLILRDAIESHNGAVFKTIGDAFCAAFADPADAASAVLAAQRALAAERWGEVGHVRVRMALHTGEPEHRDRDYFGPPVNRVARILSTGYGGQTIVSQATAQILNGRLPDGVTLVDLGSHRLKDLLQPERLYQLTAPDLEREFPPIKTLDRQPHNLPAQPTPLVGRDAEVARVRELVERDGVRLVTLTGPGGTGKTRLALQAAAELVDHFADGAWFAPLAPLRDPNLVVAAIAQPLGVRESGHELLEATLIDYLRDKHLLLVLDNMEHVLAATPAIGRILAACRSIVILATSRAALRVYGERETPVPPLPLPDPKRLPPLGELAEIPAVELFVERAMAVRPGFELTDENAAAVAGICVRLEGLPLAIELAAARVRVLAPDRLLERLAGRLDLLTGGASDRDERQRTLRGAIAWSHDLLPDTQQILFRRLAVFAGGATLEEIEAVADPDFTLDALDGVEALVTQSLLRQADDPNGDVRFAMLETIREFAAERLAENGEESALRSAHAAHFLAFAEAAEPALTGAGQAEWLGRLEAEHDNLRAALAWLDTSDSHEEELRLAGALWRFWDIRGHLSEGRAWLEHALGRVNGAAPHARAKALQGAGVIASTQGDRDDAIARFEAALALSRAVDDDAGIARSTIHLGMISYSQGEFDQAVASIEHALVHYRTSRDDRGVAIALHVLSVIALDTGDDVRADELGAESLRLWRVLGEESEINRLVHHQGRLAFHRKDFAEAMDWFSESLRLSRRLKDARGAMHALAMLGRAHGEIGRLDEATAYLEESLSAAQEMGDKGDAAFALYGMAYVAKARGNHDDARRLFGESLSLYHEVGERVGIGECLEGLAAVCCATGLAFEGTLLLAAAEALRDSLGTPLPTPLIDEHARSVAAARGVLDEPTFAGAWAMGRVMSPEQAATEALASIT